MAPWFIRYPKRLQNELQALSDAGFSATLNKSARESGRIEITVKYLLDGVTHDLVATFPDLYPYFPFEITSLTFPGGRHKNQYNNSLCLLKDPHTTWSASDDTLAKILNTQIPKFVQAQQDPENATDLEAHEATQVAGQLLYVAGSYLFTGDWQINMECHKGEISIGVETNFDTNQAIRGAVLEVRDSNNKRLVSIDDAIGNRFSNTFKGRWVRLPSAPSSTNPNDILQEAAAHWPELKTPKFNKGPDVIGILFSDEVEYGKFDESWIFLVRVKTHKTRGVVDYPCNLVRSEPASAKVLQARSPKLFPLREKKILVVGLGSIGSVFAWEMARAGINQINLLDFDILQLGNTSRWMYGYMAIGQPKAHILAHLLQHEYPFVKTIPFHHRIGDVRYFSTQNNDSEVLSQALDGIDMIVDATAEWCVSHFLSDIAKEKGINYIWATGTQGSWGGTIGRVVPGKTLGCWKCFQHYLNDGNIKVPNQENAPYVQPPGCFHHTFTGTGFDMDHVTIEAVRLAVSTLCAGHNNAYPDFNWDIGIVNQFSEDGVPIAPVWQTQRLERHPKCDCNA